MIDTLESLNFRSNTDFSVSVSANSVLPTEQQTVADGRTTYVKTFAPKFIEGAVNYTVSGYSSVQKLIDEFNSLKSSYNPIELQANYLKTSVYEILQNQTIPFFIYWYDVVNTYSIPSVKNEIGSKALYQDFGDSVGYLMLYSASPESVTPTTLNTATVKPFNRILEASIPDDIRSVIEQAYKDVNQPYAENTVPVAGTAAPTTAHGSRLIVDSSNNSRYNSASGTYLSNLLNTYNQLMYLSPLYAISTQSVLLSVAPFFTTPIEGVSVVVDKFGNKVNSDQGWLEQVMLSAYATE